MKIQPVDFTMPLEPPSAAKPVVRCRFKRLFERQFSSVLLRIPPSHKLTGGGKDWTEELEPSSACLTRMVQNFIEGSAEKPEQRRCNRCNGNCTDASDDKESEPSDHSSSDACDLLKSLVPCVNVCERKLLAETERILDRNKMRKLRDSVCRRILTEGLISLGHNASICRSKWEKSPCFPGGEYEYVDVVSEGGERYIIDIDFRSEFEVARGSKAYRAVLETLPAVFVGESDRIEMIVKVVCDAARESLKQEGMPLPPWRKAEYVKAKWLSPFTRMTGVQESMCKSENDKWRV